MAAAELFDCYGMLAHLQRGDEASATEAARTAARLIKRNR
jgi:hypothetical protein